MKGGFLLKYNEVVSEKKELEEKLKELEGEFVPRLN